MSRELEAEVDAMVEDIENCFGRESVSLEYSYRVWKAHLLSESGAPCTSAVAALASVVERFHTMSQGVRQDALDSIRQHEDQIRGLRNTIEQVDARIAKIRALRVLKDT